jgi:hypothetical protein
MGVLAAYVRADPSGFGVRHQGIRLLREGFWLPAVLFAAIWKLAPVYSTQHMEIIVWEQ